MRTKTFEERTLDRMFATKKKVRIAAKRGWDTHNWLPMRSALRDGWQFDEYQQEHAVMLFENLQSEHGDKLPSERIEIFLNTLMGLYDEKILRECEHFVRVNSVADKEVVL